MPRLVTWQFFLVPPDIHAQLLTTAEVASLLRVPRRTVELWRWRRMGPPFVRLGRGVRYCIDDIEGFIRARRVGCGAESTTGVTTAQVRASLEEARECVLALLDEAGGTRGPMRRAQRHLSSLLDLLDAVLSDSRASAEGSPR